jgi:hypothetical protein
VFAPGLALFQRGNRLRWRFAADEAWVLRVWGLRETRRSETERDGALVFVEG